MTKTERSRGWAPNTGTGKTTEAWVGCGRGEGKICLRFSSIEEVLLCTTHPVHTGIYGILVRYVNVAHKYMVQSYSLCKCINTRYSVHVCLSVQLNSLISLILLSFTREIKFCQ